MNANQVSEIAGVSVRTLHHYDAIGLLVPSRNPENGYREYTEENLDTLQQILFFRACGFSLAHIQELLKRSDFDRKQAFAIQQQVLEREKARIETMLQTLKKSLQHMEGNIIMSNKEKFAGLDFTKPDPYEAEARKRWGDAVMDQSKAHIAGLTQKDAHALPRGMDTLFAKLAVLRTLDVTSAQVQTAMAEMHRFLNDSFGYTYSPEAFAGLGDMYVADARFTQNIDAYGEGLAAFLQQAMQHYATNQM